MSTKEEAGLFAQAYQSINDGAENARSRINAGLLYRASKLVNATKIMTLIRFFKRSK